MLSATLLLAILVYQSTFWGGIAAFLPAPLDGLNMIVYRTFFPSWQQALPIDLSPSAAYASFRTLDAYLFGLFTPMVALRLAGLRANGFGLRRPTADTAWPALAIAALSLPFGAILLASTNNPWGSWIYELLELAAMLPEHFLVFGVLMSIVLPRHRLAPRDDRCAADAGPQGRRLLARGMAVLSLPSVTEALAILLAALAFASVHLGGPTIEVVVAMPVGLLYAYATLLSGSIWPALLAHWGVNLALMTTSALVGTAG